jgi:hypothetical protein
MFKEQNYTLLKIISIFLRLGLRKYEYKLIKKESCLYTVLIDNSDIRDLRSLLGVGGQVFRLVNHTFLNHAKLTFKLNFISITPDCHYVSYKKEIISPFYNDRKCYEYNEDLYRRRTVYVGVSLRKKYEGRIR